MPSAPNVFHAHLRDLLRYLVTCARSSGEMSGMLRAGAFGERQNVTGCARHDVEEGQRLVVLVDFVARQLAAQDLGEEVIGIIGGHGAASPVQQNRAGLDH